MRHQAKRVSALFFFISPYLIRCLPYLLHAQNITILNFRRQSICIAEFGGEYVPQTNSKFNYERGRRFYLEDSFLIFCQDGLRSSDLVWPISDRQLGKTKGEGCQWSAGDNWATQKKGTERKTKLKP